MRLQLITHFSSLILPLLAQSSPTANTTYLTAPALVTINNHTVIQCWRLTTPFLTSSTPGISGAKTVTITNVTDLAYAVLPPRFDGGVHTAPVPQIIHFLSGVAHVTLPEDPEQDLWIVGGVGGLLFATDTTGSGHITTYPSDQQTVAIAAPFEGGIVPGYEVVKEGGCEGVQSFV